MVELAIAGLRVVRLKGGDPMIFGRVGEEIEALRSSKVPFEIIPGVTSALGAAATAQIPLTHRRGSDAVVFITAHRASAVRSREFGNDGHAHSGADWSKLAEQWSNPRHLYARPGLLGCVEKVDGGWSGGGHTVRDYFESYHKISENLSHECARSASRSSACGADTPGCR